MMEPSSTAGMSQKYRAENAIECASMLMYVLAFGPSLAAGVRPKAIAIEPMNIICAATTGRNCVARSAARASAVPWQMLKNSIFSSVETVATS